MYRQIHIRRARRPVHARHARRPAGISRPPRPRTSRRSTARRGNCSGTTQEQWLFSGLHESVREKRPWQILGQQVMFAPQAPPGSPREIRHVGRLSRRARRACSTRRPSAGVPHLVVFTGDVHSSWAYDLARDPFDPAKYDPQTGRGAIGTEIVTPAVTSPARMTPDRLASAPRIAAAPQIPRGGAIAATRSWMSRASDCRRIGGLFRRSRSARLRKRARRRW